MNCRIYVTGDVDSADTAKHAEIQRLAQGLVTDLAAAGMTVSTSEAETPSGTTTPIPETTQSIQVDTATGGTATVSGDDLTTGNDIHPNTPGSPPKAPL